MLKRILCFGDSNTWGLIPGTGRRFDENKRWPALLQTSLGPEFHIIEDGLCGRTVVHPDPSTGRFAAEPYFSQSLQIHSPLHTLILALGTNDLKRQFDLSTHQIAQGMQRLVTRARAADAAFVVKAPRNILMLCPPRIGPLSESRRVLFEGAAEKQSVLPKFYEAVARQTGVDCCLGTANIEPSGIDGVHLDARGHREVLNTILPFVREYAVRNCHD